MVDPARYCLERVTQSEMQNALDFTALASAPDGTLYAARPLSGAVYALRDTDSDGLPDSPTLLVDGLDRPNALLYHNETLYIGTRDAVYQWRDSTLSRLIESLPRSTLWNGGLALTQDNRLLIGISTGCEDCDEKMRHGGVLACSIEGGICEPFAYGLRQPLGLAWDATRGALWVTDSLDGQADEVNLVYGGEHLGYPFCGDEQSSSTTSLKGYWGCNDYTNAVGYLPSGSTPAALTLYYGEAFPHLNGQVLVLLSGSYNQARTAGYALTALAPNTGTIAYLAPFIEAGRGLHNLNEMQQNRGEGFYPHRLYGLTINAQGWIYFSGGGTIYAIRPR